MKSFHDAFEEAKRDLPFNRAASFHDVLKTHGFTEEDMERIATFSINGSKLVSDCAMSGLVSGAGITRGAEEGTLILIVQSLLVGIKLGESRLRDQLKTEPYEQQKAAKAAEQNKE